MLYLNLAISIILLVATLQQAATKSEITPGKLLSAVVVQLNI